MSAIARPRVFFLILLVGFLLGFSPQATVQLQWDVAKKRNLRFSTSTEMMFLQGKFQEKVNKSYTLSLDGTGWVEIYEGEENAGRYRTSKDGRLESTEQVPPLQVELIAHTLPPSTADVRLAVGNHWEVLDPPNEVTSREQGLVSLQEKREYHIVSLTKRGTDTEVQFEVEGYLRLFDNPGLRGIVGPPQATEASGKAEASIKALSQWGLYLTGTMTWSVVKGAPTKGDFTYVLLPQSGRTKKAVQTSENRNHFTFTLIP